MDKPDKFVRVTKRKRGKLNITTYEMNEPSEEAILECRKAVTKLLNERIRNGKPI